MTDRLSLAKAKIERSAAERIAPEIFDAIHDSVATKADVQRVDANIAAVRAEMNLRFAELEHRLTVRFASVMVVLTGIILAAIRYLPPAH
jgi:hypothetical protein